MKRLNLGLLAVVLMTGSISMAAKPVRTNRNIQRMINLDTRLCTQEYVEKHLSYDAILAKRIRIRKGEEPEDIKSGQSFRDYYMEQYAAAEERCRTMAREYYLGK